MTSLRRGSYTYKKQQGWQPGEHTIAYYPLKEDVLDYSGNNNNGSGNPNSFTDGVANYSGNATVLPKSIIDRNIYTVNVRVNSNLAYSSSRNGSGFMTQHTSASRGFYLSYLKNHGVDYFTGPNQNTNTAVNYLDNSLTGWHMISAVSDGTNMYLYVDGSLKGQNTFAGNNGQTLYLGYDNGYNSGAYNGKISNLIVEDIARTAGELLKYYNQTKNLYGITS